MLAVGRDRCAVRTRTGFRVCVPTSLLGACCGPLHLECKPVRRAGLGIGQTSVRQDEGSGVAGIDTRSRLGQCLQCVLRTGIMPVLNIRNLATEVHARLRMRAALANRSMEAEARAIRQIGLLKRGRAQARP